MQLFITIYNSISKGNLVNLYWTETLNKIHCLVEKNLKCFWAYNYDIQIYNAYNNKIIVFFVFKYII